MKYFMMNSIIFVKNHQIRAKGINILFYELFFTKRFMQGVINMKIK